ncbi:MAG: hypothetical protein R3266_13015, partial [Gemmatimonadota bacterium]|nr:hypothetical protein [Gemmatimonadota bacterium]
MEAKAKRRRLRLLERAARERDYLLSIPGVLGYAVGYRVRGGQQTDEPVLTIYVEPGRKAVDPKSLPRHRRIPERVRLDVRGRTVWLSTDLVETESGELLSNAGPLPSSASVGNSESPSNTG